MLHGTENQQSLYHNYMNEPWKRNAELKGQIPENYISDDSWQHKLSNIIVLAHVHFKSKFKKKAMKG